MVSAGASGAESATNLLLSLALSASGMAQSAPSPKVWNAPQVEMVQAEPASDRLLLLGGDWKVQFAPTTFLYPRYIADPRRPIMSVTLVEASKSESTRAGKSRYGVRIGQRFGVARFFCNSDVDHGFQIDVEIGFSGQFDRGKNKDIIGWDGLYGVHLTWFGHQDVALRLGVFHDSSHLGDEFIAKTGRLRIGYSREELLVGASWFFTDDWLAYGEFGHGYNLNNEQLMEPGRFQFGLEYERDSGLWNGGLGWYVAADVSAYEENDWDRNLTLQAGVLLGGGSSGSVWRFGLEYYDGRSKIGEFFQDDETHLALGFWFDL